MGRWIGTGQLFGGGMEYKGLLGCWHGSLITFGKERDLKDRAGLVKTK